MAITTRSSQTKEKPISRALAAIAPSPVECHQEQISTWISKSFCTTNVNPLIAELNQAGAQFNNVLEALCPAMITMNEKTHNDNLSNPCDFVPPTDKANRVTPLASSTCIDLQSSNEPTPTTNKNITTLNIGEGNSPQAKVRISETTETVDVNLSPAAATTSRRSILQSTTKSTSHSSNSFISDDNASQNKTHIKEVHDQSNMLFKEYSDDGMKETSYHVTDFAGLYPVWPIIEFLMAPTGEAKDDRMNSFTKCMVALLGEILYVDDTAKIATISIMENESSYIGSKEDLPTNFTKLGQYIMISRGS